MDVLKPKNLRSGGDVNWRRFVGAYAATIDRAASRATTDEEEGRAIAAEVLERFHADWPAIVERFLAVQHSERSSFAVWLAVVARRAAIDLVRARHGRRSVPAEVRRGAPWLKRAWKLGVVERRSAAEVLAELRNEPGAPSSEGEIAFLLAHLDRAGPRRVRSGVPERDDERVAHEPSAPAAAGSRGAQARLSKILRGLAGDDRLLLRLYFLEGASAEALRRLAGSQTRSQVYNRIHALTNRIRTQLEAAGVTMDDLGDPRAFDVGEALGSGDGEHCEGGA